MPVKSCPIQAEVFTQRGERFAPEKQILDGANITVICAPLDQRNAVLIYRVGAMTFFEVLEHQIRAPVRNLIEHRAPPVAPASDFSLACQLAHHCEISPVVVRLINWCLADERDSAQLRVANDPAKRLRANLSIADVLVPVNVRIECRL